VEKFEKLENRSEKAVQTVQRLKPTGEDPLSEDFDIQSDNEPLTKKYDKDGKVIKEKPATFTGSEDVKEVSRVAKGEKGAPG
jgi:hypothetical protein